MSGITLRPPDVAIVIRAERARVAPPPYHGKEGTLTGGDGSAEAQLREGDKA